MYMGGKNTCAHGLCANDEQGPRRACGVEKCAASNVEEIEM